MKDQLFDTKEKRDLAVANLTTLKINPGWIIVAKILDANIEVIRQQILDGIDGETKETIQILRDKLKAYENLRDTPDIIIKQLTEGKPETPSLDPFQTKEELMAERNKRT